MNKPAIKVKMSWQYGLKGKGNSDSLDPRDSDFQN